MHSYFQTVPNYLSKTQLDSYNIFLHQQIPKVVREFNPFVYQYNTFPRSDQYQFEVQVIVGGTVSPEQREYLRGHTVDDMDELRIDVQNTGKSIFIENPSTAKSIWLRDAHAIRGCARRNSFEATVSQWSPFKKSRIEVCFARMYTLF